MDQLATIMEQEGNCVVDNFTVGRYNYGNIFYPDSFDVQGLNLDEIGNNFHCMVISINELISAYYFKTSLFINFLCSLFTHILCNDYPHPAMKLDWKRTYLYILCQPFIWAR